MKFGTTLGARTAAEAMLTKAVVGSSQGRYRLLVQARVECLFECQANEWKPIVEPHETLLKFGMLAKQALVDVCTSGKPRSFSCLPVVFRDGSPVPGSVSNPPRRRTAYCVQALTCLTHFAVLDVESTSRCGYTHRTDQLLQH